MKKKAIRYWDVLKETVSKFIDDDPFTYSASIAFYTIFSLPGILIIAVVVAGAVYEDQHVKNALIEQIQSLFGSESATEVNKVLANSYITANSFIAKLIGVLTLMFSATTVFISLQNSLNNIWNIKPKPKKEVFKFFFNRLLSLSMVISIGFLLLVSLVIDALLVVFKDYLSSAFNDITVYLVSILNLAVSLGVITLVFAMIFKILPDANIRWKDVWIGAFVTTLLFLLGKYLIGVYLGNSTLGSTYGAAGSLVLLLIWIYYSVLILLFGAEFTLVYTKQIGRKIKPKKNAVVVRVTEVEDENAKLNE